MSDSPQRSSPNTLLSLLLVLTLGGVAFLGWRTYHQSQQVEELQKLAAARESAEEAKKEAEQAMLRAKNATQNALYSLQMERAKTAVAEAKLSDLLEAHPEKGKPNPTPNSPGSEKPKPNKVDNPKPVKDPDADRRLAEAQKEIQRLKQAEQRARRDAQAAQREADLARQAMPMDPRPPVLGNNPGDDIFRLIDELQAERMQALRQLEAIRKAIQGGAAPNPMPKAPPGPGAMLVPNPIDKARRALREKQFEQARQLLDQTPQGLRQWEWRHLDKAQRKIACVHTLPHLRAEVACVAVSPKGTHLLAGDVEGRIHVFDLKTHKRIRECHEHRGSVTSLAFAPDGRWFASCGKDGSVVVWETATGNRERTLKGHSATVRNIAFSANGERLCSVGDDCRIIVWDAASGTEILALREDDALLDVAYSADGRHLAYCSAGGMVGIADLNGGVHNLLLPRQRGEVHTLAFSPDGTRLATAGFDQRVHLWDLATGDEVLTCYGHRNAVRSLAFSSDGQRLVSGGNDAVRIWDTSTGEEVMELDAPLETTSVAFSDDGKIAVAIRSEVKVWE